MPRSLLSSNADRLYVHPPPANYRRLILEQYRINNPDLDKISAYYAEKFHDEATPNWLKRQHPATHSQKDDIAFIDGLKMILAGGTLAEAEGNSPDEISPA